MTKQINGHQDRVRRERSELKQRCERLRAFMLGSVFDTLPEDERARLSEQQHYMDQYLRLLGERIEWFDSQDV